MKTSSALLQTNWRYYRKSLILGILLTPFFGVGILIIAFFIVKIRLQQYRITDKGIADRNTFLPFEAIESVKLSDYRVLKSGNIASLTIKSKDASITLLGIRDASATQVQIEQRAQFLRERMRMELESQARQPKYAAGNLERLNDLVGLWQQGLLTDEQFDEEKRKFS